MSAHVCFYILNTVIRIIAFPLIRECEIYNKQDKNCNSLLLLSIYYKLGIALSTIDVFRSGCVIHRAPVK